MNRRGFYGDPAAFDAQLQRLERAVQAAPADPAARFLLAYNLYFTGQRASAAEHFRALGDKDPEAQLFLRELSRAQ
jgi:thioredoxin-like negative regulator of GroEL